MADGIDASPAEARYENTAALEWTVKAHEMLRRGELHARAFYSDEVLSAHVWGTCPRCGHALDVRETLAAAVITPRGSRGWWTALTGAITGQPTSRDFDLPAEIPIDVGCACEYPHAGAPDRTWGCGVSFRIQARVGSGAT
jgi:predicted alpha-1,6-mannanase (GH76 family)